MNTKVINKLEVYVLHKSEIWSKITYCATAWEIFLWTFIRLISIHNDLSIVSFNEHEFQKFYVAWLCGQFKLICSFTKTSPNNYFTKLYLDYFWCEYFMIQRNCVSRIIFVIPHSFVRFVQKNEKFWKFCSPPDA